MSDLEVERGQDRRVKRTRSAIVSAFNRLILERGYDALTPGHVAEAADVGRSTFYEHFRGLDGVLAETLSGVLAPLADGCFETAPTEAARRAVAHIWQNRRTARALLSGAAQPIVQRTLAEYFLVLLRRRPADLAGRAMLEPELMAQQLAAGQLAILAAWLSGRSVHTAAEIADAMQVSGRAVVVALGGGFAGKMGGLVEGGR
jgi:AcrR family transcriptional regulator